MTRRRQSRRRHRSERREREATGAPAPAPAPAPATAAEPWYRAISWTGLIGGITGFLALAQSAFYILINDPEDVDTRWVIPIFAAAAVYLPAVWVSLRPNPNRRKIIRGVLVITMVLMVIGAILLDPAFFGLLLIPSALLAHAAGLIYQGRSQPPDRA